MGGFFRSAVSQKLSGHKVNWKKSVGEAVKGAVIGATQGAMVASGVKILGAVANAANFIAGTIGSAAEQGIGRGRVSIGRSILGGIDNMIGNSRYGTGRLENLKNATARGVKAGAANAGLGYSMAKGYQYGVSQTGFGKRKKPSLKGFIGETMRGAVTGGVTSAAFYGAGKGIEKLWNGFRAGRKEGLILPDEHYQKMDENITKAMAARDAEDIVFRGLGGNTNANIIMTPAVRPRNNRVIPVCLRCQTKYPLNQFVKGTVFQ